MKLRSFDSTVSRKEVKGEVFQIVQRITKPIVQNVIKTPKLEYK